MRRDRRNPRPIHTCVPGTLDRTGGQGRSESPVDEGESRRGYSPGEVRTPGRSGLKREDLEPVTRVGPRRRDEVECLVDDHDRVCPGLLRVRPGERDPTDLRLAPGEIQTAPWQRARGVAVAPAVSREHRHRARHAGFDVDQDLGVPRRANERDVDRAPGRHHPGTRGTAGQGHVVGVDVGGHPGHRILDREAGRRRLPHFDSQGCDFESKYGFSVVWNRPRSRARDHQRSRRNRCCKSRKA